MKTYYELLLLIHTVERLDDKYIMHFDRAIMSRETKLAKTVGDHWLNHESQSLVQTLRERDSRALGQ